MRGVKGTKAPHGTRARYNNHGCRCDDCRAASRDYEREKYGRQPRAEFDAERAAKHGTESKYNVGCRCDLCRSAANKARRQRARRNIEATRAYDREYKRRRRSAA